MRKTMTNAERFEFGLKRVIDALDREDEKTALSLYRAIRKYRPEESRITLIAATPCGATT